jgi:hypothetical protein
MTVEEMIEIGSALGVFLSQFRSPSSNAPCPKIMPTRKISGRYGPYGGNVNPEVMDWGNLPLNLRPAAANRTSVPPIGFDSSDKRARH